MSEPWVTSNNQLAKQLQHLPVPGSYCLVCSWHTKALLEGLPVGLAVQDRLQVGVQVV
jgi:hypothetical protein